MPGEVDVGKALLKEIMLHLLHWVHSSGQDCHEACRREPHTCHLGTGREEVCIGKYKIQPG